MLGCLGYMLDHLQTYPRRRESSFLPMVIMLVCVRRPILALCCDFRCRVAGNHGGGRRRERRSSDQKWKWGRSGATVGGGDVARRMPRMSGEMAGSGADGSLTRKLSVICAETDAGLEFSERRNFGSLNGTYRLRGRWKWRLGGGWMASGRPIEKSSSTKRERGLSV